MEYGYGYGYTGILVYVCNLTTYLVIARRGDDVGAELSSISVTALVIFPLRGHGL